MTEYLLETFHEFRGDYPDIPFPTDIDLSELGDVRTVTLPIGKVGARSRNKRTYTRQAIENLVQEVNTNRPEGGWGHVPDSELSTRYDPPAVRWLAALLDDKGMAWGKLLPLTNEASEHFRVARATKARVGTSLVGVPVMKGDQVLALKIDRIDIADPTRVGVLDAVAVPHITKEMEGDMPEPINISELKASDVPATLREQIIAEYEATQKSAQRISELEVDLGKKDTKIQELETKLSEQAKTTFKTDLDKLIAETVKDELKDLRPGAYRAVVFEIGKECYELDKAKKALKEYTESDEYKSLAKSKVTELAGPSAIVGGNGKTITELANTPEAVAEARSRMGL